MSDYFAKAGYPPEQLEELDRRLDRILHMDGETRWMMVWICLAAAATIAEVIALRSGKPHAPMCHHVRRLPAGHRAARWALVYGAWKLHRHLYFKEKQEMEEQPWTQ